MYADYSFYTDTFYGDTLTESNANKWLDRASDFVDVLTFNRLETAFPTEERHIVRVKKAVCAIADALFLIDTQRKAGAAQIGADGKYTGAISSISSGKESISYATGGTASVYSVAASSNDAADRYTRRLAEIYLANVPDADGVNLLYAGID